MRFETKGREEKRIEVKSCIPEMDICRKTISKSLDKADIPECEDWDRQECIIGEISCLIWERLEHRAIKRGALECNGFGNINAELSPVVSLRQLYTAMWFLERLSVGDRKAAFHYLNEYVNNYQEGWLEECSEHELQVIWLMIQLIKKMR